MFQENKIDESVFSYLKSYRVNNITLDKFLDRIIKEWENSDEYQEIVISKKYYQNKNDILDKKRYKPGKRKEIDKRLNNAKETHNFLRKLVKQKSNYIFSIPFSVNSDNDTYTELLTSNYFTKKFKKTLKVVAEDSITSGISWLQPYYNENGELNFKRIPSEQCIPLWRDIDHTILDGMIRIIPIKIYEDEKTIEIKEVELYVGPNIFVYKVENGVWGEKEQTKHFAISVPKVIKTEPNEEGEVEEIIQKNEEGKEIYEDIPLSWDRIPFIAFRYNSDEIPLLRFVKSLIDSYDRISSVTTDVIVDIPDNIKVIRNYDGTDLGELAENIYTYRMVKVSGDGSIESLDTNLDITPIDSQLNRLRKDIYDMGQGVDVSNDSAGDKSGVALKYIYSGLDLDCNGLISEFNDSLEELLFYIDTDLDLKGYGDYYDLDVDFTFKKSGIINEKEVIENIKNSEGLLPDEYLIKEHPFVDDADRVMKILEEEKQEQEDKAEEIYQNYINKSQNNDNNEEDNINTSKEDKKAVNNE